MTPPRPMQKPAGNNLRRPADFNKLWHGKGRARMIEVYKNLGFWDVCECDPAEKHGWRYRKDSGRTGSPGMAECTYCHHLLWPMQYIYECDECLEPFLIDKFPPPMKHQEDLLCPECE
jgi:hypothetical protein